MRILVVAALLAVSVSGGSEPHFLPGQPALRVPDAGFATRPAALLSPAAPLPQAVPRAADSESVRPRPSPRLGPDEVIRIQLEALRTNSAEHGDSGIALAFEFSSPGNREAMGPLPQFTQMVRSPSYSPILGHRRAELGPMLIVGRQAQQVVTVVSRSWMRYTYVFVLTKQEDGLYQDCWMTDGVVLTESPHAKDDDDDPPPQLVVRET